jgi:protein-S-isoprenylcysteine O-methyltransferase Ste14
MNIEVFFRIMLGLALVAMIIIRKYYEGRASQIEKDSLAEDRDTRTKAFMLGLVITVGLLTLSNIAGLIRVIYPPWVGWSALMLPEWPRWIGLLLAIAGTLLLYWTHRTLDLNFFGGRSTG